MAGQIVQTQIRLLEEESDQVNHCLLFYLHYLKVHVYHSMSVRKCRNFNKFSYDYAAIIMSYMYMYLTRKHIFWISDKVRHILRWTCFGTGTSSHHILESYGSALEKELVSLHHILANVSFCVHISPLDMQRFLISLIIVNFKQPLNAY